tara:strand:+ start:1990 stop:2838 length:849 start_codon:yes stop_codon:yes gene_type:complete
MESLRSEEDPNIDKVTLYANQEVIRDAIEILNRGRVCIECQQLFTYRESLGKFQCKKHIDYKQGNVCLPVKTFDSISERFQWSCCGRYDMRVVYTPNNDVFQSFYTNIARVPFSTGSRRFYDKPIGHLPVAPGCIPCDHRISDDLSEIVINDIAAILPYLDGDLLTLTGFDKDEMIIRRFDLNQVRLQKLKQTFDIDIFDSLTDKNKDQFIQDFDIDNWDKLTHEQKEKNKDLFLEWILNGPIDDVFDYVKTLNQENKNIINDNLNYIHAEKRYVRYESETG